VRSGGVGGGSSKKRPFSEREKGITELSYDVPNKSVMAGYKGARSGGCLGGVLGLGFWGCGKKICGRKKKHTKQPLFWEEGNERAPNLWSRFHA